MKPSLTYSGIFVIIAGTFLVNSLGFTDSCSTELTGKLVEFGPVIVGSVMAFFGRKKIGGQAKELREQIVSLGGKPVR